MAWVIHFAGLFIQTWNISVLWPMCVCICVRSFLLSSSFSLFYTLFFLSTVSIWFFFCWFHTVATLPKYSAWPWSWGFWVCCWVCFVFCKQFTECTAPVGLKCCFHCIHDIHILWIVSWSWLRTEWREYLNPLDGHTALLEFALSPKWNQKLVKGREKKGENKKRTFIWIMKLLFHSLNCKTNTIFH